MINFESLGCFKMRSLFLFLVTLFPVLGYAQINSVGSGDWSNPSTWSCACVPSFADGIIRIDPTHTVTVSTTINADEIVVSADAILTIETGGRLIVRDGTGADLDQEQADQILTFIDGTVIVNSGGIIENRGQIVEITASMIFETGSEYQHNQNGNSIPLITWQTGSTCRITGWTTTTGSTPMTNFRTSLSQNFHHFIWDSQNQTASNVQLNGFLTTVNGNLILNNTTGPGPGNRALSLGGNNTILNVGGDFVVNSLGRVSVAVSAGGTFTMNVQGNCNLSSTVGVTNYQIGGSGLTGITNLNVTGDLILNSGQLNLAPAAGAGNVNVSGNLGLNGGSILKPGAGTGNLSFTGAVSHNLTVGSGTFTGGNLVVQAGTLNLSGNTLAMGGNITIQSGATFNMPAALSTTGDLLFVSSSTINSNNGTISLTGSTISQTINANGATLNNMTINKSIDAANVSLTSPLLLTGQLNIVSPNPGTVLNSTGNLTLLSISDGVSGNAQIGPLLNTASIAGNVTVQRFMSPEGRIYRYISSPVTNAPVSQLQDDFPITGTFVGNNNGACTGCSTNPSMFFYNAAFGSGQYAQFPVSANTEQLTPGRGYAAFIRQDVVPLPGIGVTFDLTGPINQGDVSLPVFHNTSVPSESWNLVGNPYPSSIDWDDASWTKTNISASIAVRDAGAGIFQVWDGSTGGLTGGVIASGQGFWVRTTAASPQLIIKESAKTATSGAFLRTEGADVITMTLTKGSLYDKAYFKFRAGALLGFDNYDAPKLVNDNFDFSSRFANTSQLAINAVNDLPCGSELYLDLRFTKNSSGAFVINPQGSYNVDFEISGSEFDKYKISLLDQFTGAEFVVTPGFKYDFSISSDPASLASDRLKLRFEGILPSLNLALAGADVVCGSKEATLVVKNTDKKFEYFLSKGDEVVSIAKSGTGGDLSIAVPGSSLLPGSNQLKVGVKGVCGIEFLTNKWEVTRYQDASISVQEGDILISNYTTGNQWFFNDELILGANSQVLKVEKSGIYSLEVNTGGCTSRSIITYAVTGIESEPLGVSVYPNPFTDKVYLTSKDLFNPATKVSVSNSLGQEVCNQSGLTRDGNETGFVNLGNLPEGMYFLRISLPTGVGVYKILKGLN
jgi:trimeric autotransporter adhesin